MPLLSSPQIVGSLLGGPNGLLEAPRIRGDGTFLFSDVLRGGVYALAANGGARRQLVPGRRGVGGLLLHADGGIVISGKSLIHVAPDGAQRDVLCGGSDAAGFNDLGTAPDGDVLAGVMKFRPFGGEEPVPGELIRVGRNGRLSVLSTQVLWPNGIGVSPDGERIYVSDYAQRHVLAVRIGGGGEEVFASVPSGSADGLAVDASGGVWVALGEGGGVARFTPGGDVDEVLDVASGFVSSLSFGGADRRDVLITTAANDVAPDAGGALFTARSEVPGLTVALATA